MFEQIQQAIFAIVHGSWPSYMPNRENGNWLPKPTVISFTANFTNLSNNQAAYQSNANHL